mgnify:FL=1
MNAYVLDLNMPTSDSMEIADWGCIVSKTTTTYMPIIITKPPSCKPRKLGMPKIEPRFSQHSRKAYTP